MKLLVLTEDFYPTVSGGAHLKWRFCQLAAERGHDVVVYTHRGEGMSKRETVDGVEIRRPFKAKPDSLAPHATLAFPFRLLASVVLCAYLLLHLRNSDFEGVYTGSNTLHWVGKVLSRMKGVPGVNFIGYTPSLHDDGGSSMKRFLERVTFKYGLCSTVFCRNPQIRERIQHLSDQRVEVIHGILNTDNIRSAFEANEKQSVRQRFTSDDETMLVFVGRLSEIKNVPAAVETVAMLPRSFCLVIVGDGPERGSIESVVTEEGVQDRVDLVGELEHDEALSIIAAAEGLVLPSDVEAYPSVAFEGLALGCEVFARPVGILPEIDHSRLHLQQLDDFTGEIAATDFERAPSLDEETLRSYSVVRYADTVLQAFEDARGGT